MEEYAHAQKVGWNGITRSIIVHILSFLSPLNRLVAGESSKMWRNASIDVGFMLRVLPAECGNLKGKNVFKSLTDALKVAKVGDVIELGQGHHWEDGDVVVKEGIMIEGDEVAPDKVVVELSGSFVWEGRGGGCVGVTVRRPKMGKGCLVHVKDGRCMFVKCVLDATLGDDGEAVAMIGGHRAEVILEETVIKGSENGWGVKIKGGGVIKLDQSVIVDNALGGVNVAGREGRSKVEVVDIEKCTVQSFGGQGYSGYKNLSAHESAVRSPMKGQYEP